MGKKELSEDLRLWIVDAHKQGKGYKKISKQFEVPVAMVQSIIKKFKNFGTVKNLMGRGQKAKMSVRDGRKLVRKVADNPRITSKALLSDLKKSGTNISRSTLKRTLHRAGLRGCRPRKTPLLTAKHRAARLAFARAHLDKDPSFWKSVLWSDETKMELFGHRDDALFGGRSIKGLIPKTPSQPSSMVVGTLIFGVASLPEDQATSLKSMES
ncbi:uncharacterized protein LOC143018394 [Oratosquilla oratoria]|uniref:uncharacterized protein LOC143018394 n=1 Tax=Oratosquilla oratoria TaxID=337810 RepID=UPI003F765FD6